MPYSITVHRLHEVTWPQKPTKKSEGNLVMCQEGGTTRHITRLPSQVVLVVKNPPVNAEDTRDEGSVPGSGRSPGGRHGNPLQYSCLENPMDREDWQAIVHRVAKSWTQLK